MEFFFIVILSKYQKISSLLYRLFKLQKALKALDIASDEYLVSTCSLHNLQTMLRNAVVIVLGDGGQDENGHYVMNVMQMLHGAYNIQNYHNNEELKTLWTYLDPESERKSLSGLKSPYSRVGGLLEHVRVLSRSS